MLLILHTLLAKLGLSSAICWLGADSLLVSISPPLAYAAQQSQPKQWLHRLNIVELSTTFTYGSAVRHKLLIGNIAKVSCLISL
jgi:hypothetical protein